MSDICRRQLGNASFTGSGEDDALPHDLDAEAFGSIDSLQAEVLCTQLAKVVDLMRTSRRRSSMIPAQGGSSAEGFGLCRSATVASLADSSASCVYGNPNHMPKSHEVVEGCSGAPAGTA